MRLCRVNKHLDLPGQEKNAFTGLERIGIKAFTAQFNFYIFTTAIHRNFQPDHRPDSAYQFNGYFQC